MNGVVLALGLTFVADMATAIGSAVAFFARRTNYRFLSIAAGFSAGVMLHVSFVEIFLKGGQSLTVAYGEWGTWVNVAAFPTSRAYGKGHDSLLGVVAGMLVMALSLLLLS